MVGQTEESLAGAKSIVWIVVNTCQSLSEGVSMRESIVQSAQMFQ